MWFAIWMSAPNWVAVMMALCLSEQQQASDLGNALGDLIEGGVAQVVSLDLYQGLTLMWVAPSQ